MKQMSMMDALVGELMNAEEQQSPLDLCLSGDRKLIAAVPLRFRLIALGFVQRLTPDEVNRKLEMNGCARLYARNIREASLIYAFRSGLPYEAWKELDAECVRERSEVSGRDRALSKASISCRDLRSYVEDNSLRENELALTQHRTQLLSRELSDISNDDRRFREFLISNLSSFSTVREKTRYYFCKYLLGYLETRMKRYLRALENGRSYRAAGDMLSAFRVRTALDRKKHTPSEAKEKIEASGISLGVIYAEFENFYFDSTNADWLEMTLDYYGSPEDMTRAQKKRLAEAVRKERKSLRYKRDDEIIELVFREMEEREERADARFREDNKKAAYQSGRSGENYLRKVLKGETDPDRTTFLSFLLFFGKEADIPAEQRISVPRLNGILTECGFSALNPENDCDSFFIGFMEAEDPMDFLFTKAEEMALAAENFHLYKSYLASFGSERKWEEITGA